MELRFYISLIRKWIWLVILAVLIASVSSYLASKAATPLYRTKTTLMIGRVVENPDPNSLDLWTGQQLAYTYTQLAKREPVLRGAIDSLGLNLDWQSLAENVSTNIIQQTLLIEISVLDSDPARAKALADAIAQQLILQSPTGARIENAEEVSFIQTQLSDLRSKISTAQEEINRLRQDIDAANSARLIQDLQNQINLLETKISGWQGTYSQLITSLEGGDVNAMSVVEAASLPTRPVSPNIRNNVILAAAMGLVLAVVGIVLIEYLDDTIKTPEDVIRTSGLPTLGAIARINGESYSDKLIAARQPLSPIVEAYRVLRTNLQFSTIDHPAKTILVTSPSPSEGKSVSMANLAIVLAQSGIKVIVVDTDLRRPVTHKIFNLPNRFGLSDALIQGTSQLHDYYQSVGIDNLCVLTSGPLPPNPAELLASSRMSDLISQLRSEADIVLFDSPPALLVADAAILGTRVDGVILVNDAGRTRSNESRRATEELRRVHANLLGVILNRLSVNGRDQYYYYYYSHVDSPLRRRKKQPK
jgi:non-specific protein-tyrosine kinase